MGYVCWKGPNCWAGCMWVVGDTHVGRDLQVGKVELVVGACEWVL